MLGFLALTLPLQNSSKHSVIVAHVKDPVSTFFVSERKPNSRCCGNTQIPYDTKSSVMVTAMIVVARIEKADALLRSRSAKD